MADRLYLLDPGALKFLALIPTIILLYMVRSHYRRRKVSSIMLWRSIRHDLEARQQVRLPPLSLLMLLQLLAVAVGAFALARPALPAEGHSHLVLLLDASTSMEATDVPPSRFDVAVQEARRIIQQVSPGDEVSLVTIGASPTLVASGTEMAEVLAALDHLQPGAGAVDVDAALKLGESLIRNTGGEGRIVLLSDGVFGQAPRTTSVAVPVDFEPIGVSGDNQGITSLEVRRDLDGSGRWSAFGRVANYSGRPARVTATATADGLVLETRSLSLAPRSSTDLSFALPTGTRFFALKLDTHDIYQADDWAEVRVDTPQSRSVLLVSDDPDPILRVLGSIPGLKVSVVPPASFKPVAGADLVILDGFVPPVLPGADILIMNPPESASGIVVSSASGEATVLRSERSNSLIRSIDLQSLRLGETVHLQTPEWAHTVVEGPAGPLILEGEESGRKIVVLGFDWQLFDLPRMQAFPLLISNAVADLSPLSLPESVHPGESVLVRPVADATDAVVEMPDGSHVQLSLRKGAVSFADTARIGRYTVHWMGPALGEAEASFNVNLASDAQSDIAPRPYSVVQTASAKGASTPVPGRQLWTYLALALLGLLAAEWLYFSRRS